MITSFNHSGFVVADMQREVEFYCGVLGLQVIRETDAGPDESKHTGLSNANRKLVFLGKPGQPHALELVHFMGLTNKDIHGSNTSIGAAHVCFNVEGLDKCYAEWVKNGMEFLTPLVERIGPDGNVGWICYGKDPEGNWLEFIDSGTNKQP